MKTSKNLTVWQWISEKLLSIEPGVEHADEMVTQFKTFYKIRQANVVKMLHKLGIK